MRYASMQKFYDSAERLYTMLNIHENWNNNHTQNSNKNYKTPYCNKKKLINIIEPIPYNADTVSETLFDQEKNI